MTRIRYTKNIEANTLSSSKPILCGETFCRVSIDLNTMEWFVIASETNAILAKGTNDTIAKIKKDVKTATVTLGATYYSEVRNRKLILTNAGEASVNGY
jgi:hypothetical protein